MIKFIIIGVIVLIILAVVIFVFFSDRDDELKEARDKLLEKMREAGLKITLGSANIGIKPLQLPSQTLKIDWWTQFEGAFPVFLYQESVRGPFIFAWKSDLRHKGHLIIHRRAESALSEGFMLGAYSAFTEIKPEDLEKPLTGRISAFARPEGAVAILHRTNVARAFLGLDIKEALHYENGYMYFMASAVEMTDADKIRSTIPHTELLEKALHEEKTDLDGGDPGLLPDEVTGVTYLDSTNQRQHFGKLLVDKDKIVFAGGWDQNLTVKTDLSAKIPMVEAAELDASATPFLLEIERDKIRKSSFSKNPLLRVGGDILIVETDENKLEFQSEPRSNKRLRTIIERHKYVVS